jgi:hypothetical protein
MNKIRYFPFKLLIVTGFFLLTSSFVLPFHRFYLSLTEIRVDTKKQTLDVSSKMFTDDIENLLLKKYGKKIDLSSSTKNKEVHSLLNNYVNENLMISIGGKKQNLGFVGFETDADATWIYLETVPFNDKGKVVVTNTLLYEHIPDQAKLINFYWNDV